MNEGLEGLGDLYTIWVWMDIMMSEEDDEDEVDDEEGHDKWRRGEGLELLKWLKEVFEISPQRDNTLTWVNESTQLDIHLTWH